MLKLNKNIFPDEIFSYITRVSLHQKNTQVLIQLGCLSIIYGADCIILTTQSYIIFFYNINSVEMYYTFLEPTINIIQLYYL